ncbi:MAG TPA: ATP-binding protein [Acidobacteriota bacterium]
MRRSISSQWIWMLAIGALVAIINLFSIRTILAERDPAIEEVLDRTSAEMVARARTIEALLEGSRADLAFLAASPLMTRLPAALEGDNPIAARLGRLDAEATGLLFMGAHPEVQGLRVLSLDHRPLISFGRREGAPVLLPLDSFAAALDRDLQLRIDPTPGSGAPALWASLGFDAILNHAGFTNQEHSRAVLLSETQQPIAGSQPARRSWSRAPAQLTQSLSAPAAAEPIRVRSTNWSGIALPIRAQRYQPEIAWTLAAVAPDSEWVLALERVAERARLALLLNLGSLVLALGLAAAAARTAVRATRIEAEAREREHVRRLEQQLAHSERLAALGRLSAGLAHEINNPLEGIRNYANLLHDELEARTADDLSRRYLAKIEEGLARVESVAHRVLDFAEVRPENREQLDLNKLLAEVTAFVSDNGSFRSVELETDLCERQPAVIGDRTLLFQLFLNLLLNACEAMPNGGRVWVRSRTEPGTVRVAIEDNGPGIEPEVLPHIFEPFFSQRGSSGLGLAVCEGIARAHRGALWASSRVGAGTTFVLELPPAEAS